MKTTIGTMQGIRTHCITNQGKVVNLEFEIEKTKNNTENNRAEIWLRISKGGVTGYESFQITSTNIQTTISRGWKACLGTPGKWDDLHVSSAEMGKVFTKLLMETLGEILFLEK